MREVTGYLKLG